jgi:hypothetical protein
MSSTHPLVLLNQSLFFFISIFLFLHTASHWATGGIIYHVLDLVFAFGFGLLDIVSTSL